MQKIEKNFKYTDSHEWAQVEDENTVLIGITDHAQSLLGDLVYVELPEIGQEVGKGDETGVVESVKAASDIYAPLTGTVIAINEDLEDSPELINQAPYSDGWLYKLKLNNQAEIEEMLSAEQYAEIAD